MKVTTYRQNVLRTLSIAPAKAGLRRIVQNTARTCIFHASVGLATEVAELVDTRQKLLLGLNVPAAEREELRNHSLAEMGDIGYYMTVLAKYLKVQLPSSTKKIKLVGTESAAVMQLVHLSGRILSISKKSFYGVAQAEQEKNGKVGMVLNKDQQVAAEQGRNEKMAEHLKAFIDLYYRLCHSMFGEPPAVVFAGNIAKLTPRYPDGFFTHDAAHAEHDAAKEAELAKAGAAAA